MLISKAWSAKSGKFGSLKPMLTDITCVSGAGPSSIHGSGMPSLFSTSVNALKSGIPGGGGMPAAGGARILDGSVGIPGGAGNAKAQCAASTKSAIKKVKDVMVCLKDGVMCRPEMSKYGETL